MTTNNYHDQSTNEPVECETCFTPLDEDFKCKPCDEKISLGEQEDE